MKMLLEQNNKLVSKLMLFLKKTHLLAEMGTRTPIDQAKDANHQNIGIIFFACGCNADHASRNFNSHWKSINHKFNASI